jgi:hypothetical protein
MRHITTVFRNLTARIHAFIRGEEEVTDLIIAEITPPNRLARCWVRGYIQDHAFQALMYPRHAQNPGWELGTSLISKLYLYQMADDRIVAAFERGWELQPTSQVVQMIVHRLASELAELVYGPLRESRLTSHLSQPK